jgi:hypothetical protein
MSALILLLLALAAAVLAQILVRNLVVPPRRWVASGRPRLALARRRAIARRTTLARRSDQGQVRPATEMASWGNEGVSAATGVGRPRNGLA